MSARLLAALLLAGVLAACSLGDAGSGASTITVEVSVPDRIDWRRTLHGIEIAGSRSSPDPSELAVLEAALAEVPEALVAASAVRTIYRIPADPEAEEGEALAFSRGPDVYLTDGTFSRARGRFELAAVLAHEFTHTGQFARLTDADLAAIGALEGGNVYSVTEFVTGFAREVGWRETGGTDPGWVLPDPAATTPYGSTGPSEDMAESVALVAMGRPSEVSAERARWVEDFLDASARELAAGQPYVPDGASELAPRSPLYDEARAARAGTRRIEPRSWGLASASSPAPRLARDIQEELGRRGLAGTLAPLDDDAVTRFAGEFVRGDGLRFLVELWDFREAPGFSNPPPQPVLTYVALY